MLQSFYLDPLSCIRCEISCVAKDPAWPPKTLHEDAAKASLKPKQALCVPPLASSLRGDVGMAESEVSIQSLTPSASVIRTLKPANAKGGISMKPASWLASSLAEPPKDLTKKQAKALAKKREALIAEREREQEERATCMKLAGSLRESVSVGDSDAVVQFLTSKEHRQRSATIVGLPDAMGVDALMMAARAGHHDCVEALLKLGASTSAVDDVGRTALMHAAANGQVDSVTTLIAHGAPLDTRDATAGRTAFQHALTAGYISHESEEGGRRRRLSQTPVNGEQEGELTNAHIECMMQLSHAVVNSADPFDPTHLSACSGLTHRARPARGWPSSPRRKRPHGRPR